MARIHSGHRGSSRSRPPVRDEAPDWVTLTADEVEEEVVALREQGLSAPEIGLKLRDRLGVPDVKEVTDRSITEILEDHDLAPEVPQDLLALMRRAVRLDDHVQEHPKDTSNRRGLEHVESKIRRLVKYYKKEDKLPADWTYSMEQARLLTE